MNVQQLSDLYEIQRLKARYFRYVDTKQWDKYRDLFTEEVDFGHQKGDVQNRHLSHLSHRSFDDLMSYLRTADSGKVTAHHGHMPEIEFIDDDTATGIWAMFDWVDDSTRGVAWQGYGHYHERYVRCADGQWRISAMHLRYLRIDYMEPSRSGGGRPSTEAK
jgi:hypothetical protein